MPVIVLAFGLKPRFGRILSETFVSVGAKIIQSFPIGFDINTHKFLSRWLSSMEI